MGYCTLQLESDLQEVVARFSFRNPAIRTELVVFSEPDLDSQVVYLSVVVYVPDSQTGEPVRITHRGRAPDHRVDLIRWVRGRVLAAWSHELDEALLLDGRRVVDPHPRPRLA